MSVIEDTRKLLQDFLAPELRELSARVDALEERMKLLEAKINAIYETSQDKDGRINKLENDVRFLNRLIEDKTPQAK